MLSGQEQRDIKFILQGVAGTTRLTRERHPSNPPPTLICDVALGLYGAAEEGVDERRATALYP